MEPFVVSFKGVMENRLLLVHLTAICPSTLSVFLVDNVTWFAKC